jgi:hypothetical protein
LARNLLSQPGLCSISTIERASDRFAAVRGGKVTPPSTDRGKLLPLDSDSSSKRIAYVITYHALCRHAHLASAEYSPPWPWAQERLAVGFRFRFFQQHGSSNSGWIRTKSFWQLVQFAATGHRRETRACGYEPGRIGWQRSVYIRCSWICGRGSQDKRYGLIPTSRMAASSCSAVKGLLKSAMLRSSGNQSRSVAVS